MHKLLLTLVICCFGYAHSQCEFNEGPYTASWQYEPASQSVQFSIQYSPQTPTDYWTGIGFGKRMKDGDFILITNTASGVKATDRYGIGNKEPKQDSQDDVQAFQDKVTGGQLVATFSRLVNTGDPQDQPLIDPKTGCQCFMFPSASGVATEQGSDVSLDAHGAIPARATVCNITQCLPGSSSGGQVILDGCSGETPPSTAASSGPSSGIAGGRGKGSSDPAAASVGQDSTASNGVPPEVIAAGSNRDSSKRLGGGTISGGQGSPQGTNANGLDAAAQGEASGTLPNEGAAGVGEEQTPGLQGGSRTPVSNGFGRPLAAGDRSSIARGGSANNGNNGVEPVPNSRIVPSTNGVVPSEEQGGSRGGRFGNTGRGTGAGGNVRPDSAGAGGEVLGTGTEETPEEAGSTGAAPTGTGKASGSATNRISSTQDNSAGVEGRTGNSDLAGGQRSSASGSGANIPCQPQDNGECVPYIDRYWTQIFNTINPPLGHPNRKPACNNLINHQQGQVRRECCNYLKQKCGEFMTPNDLGAN